MQISKWLFFMIMSLSSALCAQDNDLTSRLLVNIDSGADFSPKEFADAALARFIHIDERNPFKDFPKNFLEFPFVVISSPLTQESLLKLANRFGYRFVSFSKESLKEAIEISNHLLKSGPKYSSDLPQATAEESHRIYELMRKVDKVFTEHNIKYWATGGTLIGAVRFHGRMLWDDDLDICILDSDEKKLEAISEDLDGLGLGMYKKDIYVIYEKDGTPVKDFYNPGKFLPNNYPSLDVFVMTLEENNEFRDIYVHKAAYFYRLYGSTDCFKYSQIENISRVPFGPLMIPIPGDAEIFLNNNYGTSEYPDLWKSYAKEGEWDHKLGEPASTSGACFVEVDIVSPAPYYEFMDSAEIISSINEIYDRFHIMPSLQMHMKRVAAVAELILTAVSYSIKIDKDDVIAALLLHDLGNIVKFKLEDDPAWKKIQQKTIAKYGSVDHEVTEKMIQELGVSDRVASLISGMGFDNLHNVIESDDIELKICLYADQRVAPRGVVSLHERFADLRKRYKGTSLENRYDALQEKKARLLEDQIFKNSSLNPLEITDLTIEQFYRNYS
jgi:hypothetical protein